MCVQHQTRNLFKRQPSLYQTNVQVFAMKYLYSPVIAEVIDILALPSSFLPPSVVYSECQVVFNMYIK